MKRFLIATVAGALILGVTAAGASSAAQSKRAPEAVVVTDIQIPVAGQAPVTAYLVRPAKHHKHLAGALYLHWFEPPASTQNRTEFLSEAIALAGRGAVAVLPQLTFPWEGDPVGDQTDRTKVTNQLKAVEAAYGTLLRQDGVDAQRTAVIGHDYGAMYASLLGKRAHALVFMAGDATWANWFDTFWLGLPADQAVAYRKVFAGLDPVDNVGKAHDVYFQWAGRDRFVTPEVRAAFSAAKPSAKVSLYETADHFLDQPAKDDRLAWVSTELGLR